MALVLVWNSTSAPSAPALSAALPRAGRFRQEPTLLVERSISGENFARQLAASGSGMREPGPELMRARRDQLAGHAAALRAGRCLPIGSPEFVRASLRAAGIGQPRVGCPRSLAAHLPARAIQVGTTAALGRSRPVPIQPVVAEWRYYLLHGTVLGYAPFGQSGLARQPACADVSSIIADAPRQGALALDVAILEDGSAALSAVQDACTAEYFPFGACKPEPADYLQFLWWRWKELLESQRSAFGSVGRQLDPA